MARLASWLLGRDRSEPISYELTRFVLLRALGFVYLAAFFSLHDQVLGLLGSEGLTPAALYLERIDAHFGGGFEALWAVPTVFWVDVSDVALRGLALLGIVAAAVVTLGYANAPLMLLLWGIQLSFVSVGQTWFAFGWEIQLLETGMLGVFLCPLLDGRPFPATRTPLVVIGLFRWLLFRMMLGAGLIKWRGDLCWRELTCLETHFETQPIPHPGSWYFHHLPLPVKHAGVAFNHVAELVAPFFVFGPRGLRILAGLVVVVFQLNLIVSGNLAFLNWITLVPALACFDDRSYRRVLPRRLLRAAERRVVAGSVPASRSHVVAAGAFAVLVAVLSIAPVENLLSERQVMNTSFDPLKLVNTYGAFGSVGKVRNEIVLEGTADANPGPDSVWREYEWKCKPGDPMRRPCLITPYHMRLDWLIWFAAMGDLERYPWVVSLMVKLLQGDPGALGLLDTNPFPEAPPKQLRALLYRYQFTEPGDPSGAWWKREPIGGYVEALSLDDLRIDPFLLRHGLPVSSRGS